MVNSVTNRERITPGAWTKHERPIGEGGSIGKANGGGLGGTRDETGMGFGRVQGQRVN